LDRDIIGLKTIHTTKGNVITAMSAVKKLIGVIILELPEHSESQGNRTRKQKTIIEAESKVE
jgi:hypothetical protein